jgi:hypothetical protein
MTKFLGLHKSDKPEKKFYAELENDGRTKRVYFGDSHSKDFTLFNPLVREEHKRLYLQRHRARENWNDVNTPGFWSRWVLWNKPTVSASLKDTLKRYF